MGIRTLLQNFAYCWGIWEPENLLRQASSRIFSLLIELYQGHEAIRLRLLLQERQRD
jgi:hypothetical protein